MQTKSFNLNSIEFPRFHAVPGTDFVIEVSTIDRQLPAFCVAHEHDEAFVVPNGEMAIEENGELTALGDGEGALVARNTPHTETFGVGCKVLHILGT